MWELVVGGEKPRWNMTRSVAKGRCGIMFWGNEDGWRGHAKEARQGKGHVTEERCLPDWQDGVLDFLDTDPNKPDKNKKKKKKKTGWGEPLVAFPQLMLVGSTFAYPSVLLGSYPVQQWCLNNPGLQTHDRRAVTHWRYVFKTNWVSIDRCFSFSLRRSTFSGSLSLSSYATTSIVSAHPLTERTISSILRKQIYLFLFVPGICALTNKGE